MITAIKTHKDNNNQIKTIATYYMSINYFIKSVLGLAKFDPNTQMITESVITLSGFIDAHSGKRGEVGGTSCTPSEYFEKFGHKNEIKHENSGPP